MTDTFQVQGDFAPAESFVAETSVLDTLYANAVAADDVDAADDVAVTAEPNGFVELGLAPELVQAVADLGYTQPTSVQLKAIPLAMGAGAEGGRFIDLMVSSQTGSGKTAAFLLPVLHTLGPKLPSVVEPLLSAPSAKTLPIHATLRQPPLVP